MTDVPFRNLTAPGYDIAVGWDYRSEKVDTSVFKRYREVVLIAWSMGVMEAERVVPALGLPLTLTIAVNGTPTPVSDTYGIPTKIFDGTLSTLSENNVIRFNRRMCGSTERYRQFNLSAPNRPIESLREELSILGQRALETRKPFSWDIAVAAVNDMIFPYTNQLKAWKNTRIISIEAPHLPDFESLIGQLTVNKSLVAKRFRDTRDTYDNSALIQYRVASLLARKLLDSVNNDYCYKRAIEIGAGNDCLTNYYKNSIQIEELELWDLTMPAAPETSACNITPVADDAESRLMELPDDSVDLVVSSSTLQWFNSPVNAIRQIQRVLRHGGIAAISLYTEGTFSQFAEQTGVSLNYVSANQLSDAISVECRLVEINTYTDQLQFESTRELLQHLRLTGVDGVGQSSRARLRTLLRNNKLRHLDYTYTTLIIKKI